MKYLEEDLEAADANDDLFAMDTHKNLKKYQPHSLRSFATVLAFALGILLLLGGLYIEAS